MLIFYGLKYYGKSNIVSQLGRCESCGRVEQLTSYDTAQFFYIYWIPLIPTGRKRVVNFCPSCGHHHFVSAGKHKKQQEQAVSNMLENLKAEPNNVALVSSGLETLSSFNERDLFLKMASTYGGRMGKEKEVHLAIAQGYLHFGLLDEAVQAASKAIELGAGSESETLRDIAVKLKPDETSSPRAHRPTRGIPLLIPYLVPALIVLAIFGSYLSKGISNSISREVWLLSGIKTPYTIELNDEEYQITYGDPKSIKLPLGHHTVKIKGSLTPEEQFSFNNKLSFWERFHNDKVLVINPDSIAFFIKMSIPYYDLSSTKSYEPKYEYYQGRQWYEIKGVELPFEDPPKEIDLPSASSVKYLDQLYVYAPDSYSLVIETINEEETPDYIQEYITQALKYHPDNDEAFWMLASLGSSNELLQAGLARKPELIDWHRVYQNTKQTEEPEYDLVGEYQNLLKADPQNSTLQYLLGRIIDDHNEAQKLYLKSEQGNTCKGYGHHAIAYSYLLHGNYQQALEHTKQAVELAPENLQFSQTHFECLLANQNWDEVIDMVQENRLEDPSNGETRAAEIRYLCLNGQNNASKLLEKNYLSEYSSEMDSEARNLWTNYFQSVRHHVAGEIEDYLKCSEKAGIKWVPYEKALHSGNVETALKTVKEADSTNYEAYLTIYIAANYHKNEEVAKEALDTATKLLEGSTELQNMLKDPSAITPAELDKCDMWPDSKKYLAIALGYKYPNHKDEFFKIGKKYNYKTLFPYHLLNKWSSNL